MSHLDALRAGASAFVLLAVAGCGAATPLLGIAGQSEGDAGAESGTSSSGGYSTAGYSTYGYSTYGYSTAGYSTYGYSTVGYSTARASTVRASTVGYSTAHASTVHASTVRHSSTATECSPHPLDHFVPTPNLPPATVSCTAAENTALGICFASTVDAGPACNEAFLGPGGSTNDCYACVLTPSTSTSWGALVIVDSPTAVGAATYTELDMFDTGGCIAKEDPSAMGIDCATALNELTECELAACVAYCPIVSYTDMAGITALYGDGTASNPGCLGDADTAVCLTYVDKVSTACAGEVNDAGAWSKCATLENNAGSATPTAAALSAYCGEICGG